MPQSQVATNTNGGQRLFWGLIIMVQFGLSCTKSPDEHVILRCREVMSSCGECAECRIVQIENDTLGGRTLEGKMLEYEFVSPEIEHQFERDSPWCGICCTYIFEGELWTTKESCKMEVADFRILVDSACCDARYR